MENIIVTGGCGFIGCNLINKLSEKLYNVTIIDNKNTNLCNIKRKVNYLDLDIKNLWMEKNVFKDCDIVIHLAAESGVIPSIENPRLSVNVNVMGTFNCLEEARLQKIKKFIFASSGGTVLGHQTPPVTENTIVKPVSPYGATKASGESLCLSYYHSFGLNTNILRFSNVFGPYALHRQNIVPMFLKKMINDEKLIIYGDGTNTRDYTYVDDLVNAIILSMENENNGGETYQIGHGKETSVIEIVNIMNEYAQKYFNKKVDIFFENERIGEVKRNYCDISKINSELGWFPENNIEQGIEKTFKWFKENE